MKNSSRVEIDRVAAQIPPRVRFALGSLRKIRDCCVKCGASGFAAFVSERSGNVFYTVHKAFESQSLVISCTIQKLLVLDEADDTRALVSRTLCIGGRGGGERARYK